MICPRCKRPVSDTANFCGGCGLPRAEIERFYREQEILHTGEAPTVESVDEMADDIRLRLDEVDYTTNVENPTIPETQAFSDTAELTAEEPAEETASEAPVFEETAYEVPAAEEEESVPQYRYHYDYTESEPDVRRTEDGQSAFSAGAPASPGAEYTYEPAAEEVRRDFSGDQNLSTVDYIWMMVISAIPIVGLFYLIYLGFIQKDNINKRGYGRAAIIMGIFMAILVTVFFVGLFTAAARLYGYGYGYGYGKYF